VPDPDTTRVAAAEPAPEPEPTTPPRPNPIDRVLDWVDARQRGFTPAAFAFAVLKKFGDDNAGRLAVAIAYYGFFSIFPLLLVFMTLLDTVLVNNPDLREDLLESALASFPVIGTQLSEDVQPVRGSGVALIVGIALALWAGLGAMSAVQDAMSAVWNIPMWKRPNAIVARLRAFGLLAVIGVAVIASTIGASVATAIGSRVGSFALVFGLIVAAVVNVLVILLVFVVLSHRAKRWTQHLPGAVVGGVGWTVLQALGGWIIGSRLEGASDMYGTFAFVIVTLGWMYLQAQLLLYAAEVNVVRAIGLWPRSLTGRNLTDADKRALTRYAQESVRHESERVDVAFHE